MFQLIVYKIKSYFALAICSVAPALGCANAAEVPSLLNIDLPVGFEINIFAHLKQDKPRMLAVGPDGNLFVSSAKTNRVLMLPDSDQDGIAEVAIVVSDQLNKPNGLAFVQDGLLVANQNGVVKFSKENGVWSSPKPFINNLATGGHKLKTIKLGVDNHLYINVGSSCNVCIEDDASRATILRFTSTGKHAGALRVVGRHSSLPPIWAKGLRNSQAFAWHPKTGEMFATNNGADMRSDTKDGLVNDELPPEHLNKIEAGHHYGWPHCWGHQYEDPNFVGKAGFCKSTTPPAITFTSHSTPIGITFLNQSHFPDVYKDDAIVALHGSWNREQLSGYKLAHVQFENGQPKQVTDFATGWLNNNQAWGRPVDVTVGQDGALYVTDDRTSYIYRISYKQN